MPSKSLSANYAPNFRAVPSLAASWSSLSERIHALHNAASSDTSGALTDQQNLSVRRALLEAFNAIGGEDAALSGNKLASASFNVSATAITVWANLT